MLQDLIAQFGYPALVLGTFLEGEVSLLLAAYLAVRDLLRIEGVIACAFLGTFASDQLWYYLGRHHGRALLQRKPAWQPLGARANAMLARHPDLWVLGFRFMYGLRTVMPLAIGLSGYSWRRYLLLDAIGAGLWATGLSLLAYNLGQAMEGLLQELRRYQLLLLLLVVLLIGLGWLYRWRQRRRG
ncbi:DedA family protein [Pseudomonas sp. NCCP-436]|uniref:DedA family protein n=1 Tax=Pseudomonas sp. NCCP-436 TaxID=2842481 RepID=UPI001C81AA2E|nr:DedA family protein [Pseudomonas sp. NCCP-436]GIZ10888.1 DedA family protein [Pseudomonas sp. NCCP-436]